MSNGINKEMADLSNLYTVFRYPVYQILTAMGYTIPSPSKLVSREFDPSDIQTANYFAKFFEGTEFDFTRNVLRLVVAKIGKTAGFQFDYNTFYTNPFEYFLWLIQQFRIIGQLDPNEIIDAMKHKPEDINWQLLLSGHAYYNYDIQALVPVSTNSIWRFRTSYGIVSMFPLSNVRYSDLTGFTDNDEVQRCVDQYRRTKVSAKMYYSLDSGKVVNSTIWPGMTCHDATLSVASNNIKRFSFFVAYLKFGSPTSTAAQSSPVPPPVHQPFVFIPSSSTTPPMPPSPMPGLVSPPMSACPTVTIPGFDVQFPAPPLLPVSPAVTAKDKTRKKIPSAVRFQIWQRDCGDKTSGRCFCCQAEISIQAFEAGHIQSVAEGGSDSIENLVVICGPCNRSMGKTNMKLYCQRYYPDRVYNWP